MDTKVSEEYIQGTEVMSPSRTLVTTYKTPQHHNQDHNQ